MILTSTDPQIEATAQRGQEGHSGRGKMRREKRKCIHFEVVTSPIRNREKKYRRLTSASEESDEADERSVSSFTRLVEMDRLLLELPCRLLLSRAEPSEDVDDEDEGEAEEGEEEDWVACSVSLRESERLSLSFMCEPQTNAKTVPNFSQSKFFTPQIFHSNNLAFLFRCRPPES